MNDLTEQGRGRLIRFAPEIVAISLNKYLTERQQERLIFFDLKDKLEEKGE